MQTSSCRASSQFLCNISCGNISRGRCHGCHVNNDSSCQTSSKFISSGRCHSKMQVTLPDEQQAHLKWEVPAHPKWEVPVKELKRANRSAIQSDIQTSGDSRGSPGQGGAEHCSMIPTAERLAPCEWERVRELAWDAHDKRWGNIRMQSACSNCENVGAGHAR